MPNILSNSQCIFSVVSTEWKSVTSVAMRSAGIISMFLFFYIGIISMFQLYLVPTLVVFLLLHCAKTRTVQYVGSPDGRKRPNFVRTMRVNDA